MLRWKWCCEINDADADADVDVDVGVDEEKSNQFNTKCNV